MCLLLAIALPLSAASLIDSLKPGKADLKSAGVLAFGPDGILFVGDSTGAAVFAFDTDDRKPNKAPAKVDIQGLNEKTAALLGAAPDQVEIKDVAVNPISRRVYLAVARGRGADATPVILRTDSSGKLEAFSLERVRHSRVALPNAPDVVKKDGRGNSPRMEAITDLAYVNGRVFVAGLSNEEFASNLRSIPFPFQSADQGTSIEIFHGNHGRWETNAPVRTFVPYQINKEPHILAAYTCTPLVKFPVADLKPGQKVVGTTIAELGNRNRPLDMIVYRRGADEYILMNNSSRGVMKMSTRNIEKFQPIKERTDVTGLPYETIESLKGVQHLDLYDDSNAIALIASSTGAVDLKTIALP
jgi:hypothetical protein